jgi:uncharacterized protein (TIGR00369 family)
VGATGLDLMDNVNARLVEEIFRDAKFIHSLGIELVRFGFGWCETKMAKLPALEQQHGFVHAGALMTLADHTCGGAAATTMPEGKDVITVENKVSFLRPAVGQDMLCRATVLRSGKTLVFVEAEIAFERDGKTIVVAKASSTLAVIPRRHPEADRAPIIVRCDARQEHRKETRAKRDANQHAALTDSE